MTTVLVISLAATWGMVGLIWMVTFIGAYIAFLLGMVVLIAPLGGFLSDGGGAIIGIWMFIVTAEHHINVVIWE